MRIVRIYSILTDMTGIASSTFIWFREGLEAWLIVQMAWLMVQNNRQRLTILGSTLAAMFAAGALAFGAREFVTNDFDAVEGWTALAAAGLLFWTAWFCHSAAQHMDQIRDNLNSNGSLAALSLIVFLTVFREGAEIVAFLTGIYVAGTSLIDIGLGAVIGLLGLAVLVWSASAQIKRIPVKKIFRSSRYIFTALAIYFTYYGLHELLE